MTRASCAARIEKHLNRMDGVSATVDYATEKAKVTYRPDIGMEDLTATVEATGYTATPPAPEPTGTGDRAAETEKDGAGLTAAFTEAVGNGEGQAMRRRARPRGPSPDAATATVGPEVANSTNLTSRQSSALRNTVLTSGDSELGLEP